MFCGMRRAGIGGSMMIFRFEGGSADMLCYNITIRGPVATAPLSAAFEIGSSRHEFTRPVLRSGHGGGL